VPRCLPGEFGRLREAYADAAVSIRPPIGCGLLTCSRQPAAGQCVHLKGPALPCRGYSCCTVLLRSAVTLQQLQHCCSKLPACIECVEDSVWHQIQSVYYTRRSAYNQQQPSTEFISTVNYWPLIQSLPSWQHQPMAGHMHTTTSTHAFLLLLQRSHHYTRWTSLRTSRVPHQAATNQIIAVTAAHALHRAVQCGAHRTPEPCQHTTCWLPNPCTENRKQHHQHAVCDNRYLDMYL
jgi:hypothetical protein